MNASARSLAIANVALTQVLQAPRKFHRVPGTRSRARRLSHKGRCMMEETMRDIFRRFAIAAVTVVAVAGMTAAVPDTANARWGGGGWHGGGWHGGGGWAWGGFGVGVGTGLLLGAAATAPYYGGYYGY